MFYKFVLLSTLCLASCTSSAPPASCPLPSEEKLTVGEVCQSIGTALCLRLSQCKVSLNDSINGCADKFKHMCCHGAVCSYTHTATRQAVRKCSDDILEVSCQNFFSSNWKDNTWVPVTCSTL